MAKAKNTDERFKDVAQNRKALHEYEFVERLEAGLVLMGTEVKGLRERGATIRDAYAQVRDGEVYLIGLHIPEHMNSRFGHEPTRTRKLLLHRTEIDRITGAMAEKDCRSSRFACTSTTVARRWSSDWAAARSSTTSVAPSWNATPNATRTAPSSSLDAGERVGPSLGTWWWRRVLQWRGSCGRRSVCTASTNSRYSPSCPLDLPMGSREAVRLAA